MTDAATPSTRWNDRQTVPIPSSISPEAQAALRRLAAAPLADLPDPADHEGWRALVAEAHARFEAMLKAAGADRDVTVEPIDLGGIAGSHFWPASGAVPGRILYDIHGGGFYLAGGMVGAMMAMPMAVRLGAEVYSPDYRMPPDHPYPVPLEDCVAGFRYVMERHDPATVIVRGASAGANLAAAMLIRCRDEGIPMPAAVILATPEVDLTESGDSFAVVGAADVMLGRPLMAANLLYASGADLADPDLSPLFADFSKGFPPALIQAGTRDLFLSNAVRLHDALRRSGNQSELLICEGMPHGAFGGTPEDAALAADVAAFADRFWNVSPHAK